MLSNEQRPSLMIADDDPVVRSLLNMSLGEMFDIVGVCADGEEAVALAMSSRPAAALIDVEMPNGGGLRAVSGINAAAPDTAIVVLSGDESDAVVRELMQAGAVAYRRKGIDPRELAESLHASIEAHARARSLESSATP